jgi:hypothetical protein
MPSCSGRGVPWPMNVTYVRTSQSSDGTPCLDLIIEEEEASLYSDDKGLHHAWEWVLLGAIGAAASSPSSSPEPVGRPRLTGSRGAMGRRRQARNGVQAGRGRRQLQGQ